MRVLRMMMDRIRTIVGGETDRRARTALAYAEMQKTKRARAMETSNASTRYLRTALEELRQALQENGRE